MEEMEVSAKLDLWVRNKKLELSEQLKLLESSLWLVPLLCTKED
jgi:hypothetical protein